MRRNLKRYLDKKINRIGFLDIETQGSGFSANKAYLISWCLDIYDVKKNKSSVIYDMVDKKELKHANRLMFKNKKLRAIRPYDTRILKNLVSYMKKCDLIVTHYGTWFDIPMIRTRCKMQNIKFISHSDKIRFADTWRFSRIGLKIDRNTLDLASRTLQVPQSKTKIDYFWWQMATLGVKKALDYVIKHNVKDVIITKKTWFKLESDFPIPARYY